MSTGAAAARRPKFAHGQPFRRALRQRVDEHFARTGTDPRGGRAMVGKSAVLIGWLVASYVALLWLSTTWWHAAIAASSLAVAIAGTAMCIHHDANHGAYSRRRWVNELGKRTLDVLGVSSYHWSWTHNVFHHTYTNVDGIDQDLDLAPWARLAPSQPRHWLHGYQHFYMWLLYGFTMYYFVFAEDIVQYERARKGPHRFPPPRGFELVAVFGSKLAVLGWSLALPLMFHDWLLVLAVHTAVWFAAGFILGLTFQVAHCGPEARFVSASPRIDREWAVHQVETTADFAHNSRWLTWYVGGLNYQIEHHLFPRVCHLHYPAIAPIVRQTCEEFGVPYLAHKTALAALRAHGQWLRQMGAAAAPAASAAPAELPHP